MKFTFAPESSPLEGYTIKRAIHRGGFGEVYYALSDSGKEVALKLLNNNLEVELRGVTQCLNLKHPNLVTIFDIRQDADGDHWIVMEYIGGRGLHEELQRHPSGLPTEEILEWLSGITAGLSFLHDRGIVHRDLKPANVFRDQDIIKVGDVGLSKYISESRRSAQTQSVGTVYYMAPEVCHGRYGREVDVYALGVMLVEMLTGHVPFDGETTAEILMKHMTAEPDVSGVPERLRPVLLATLEKDPARRIQDIDEVERRFRAAAAELSPADFHMEHDPSDHPQPAVGRSRPRTTVAADPPPAPFPHPAPERPATAAPAASGFDPFTMNAVNRLQAVWNRLPTAARWVVGGVVVVLLLEAGIIRYTTTGAVAGLSVFVAWRVFTWLAGGTPALPRGFRMPAASETAPGPRGPEGASGTPEVDRSEQRQNAAASVDLPPVGSRPHPDRLRQTRQRIRRSVSYSPATRRRIPRKQRLTDLTNSVSISLAAAFLVTLAVYLVTSLLPEPAHAVYFGTITMLAAWAILVSGKLIEGRHGDAFLRRMTFGAIGLGVGWVAFALQDYLLLTHDDLFFSADSADGPWGLGRIRISSGTGYPTAAAFMLFFGGLFAARRWWWQTDSFRRSRFRVASTLLTMLVGAVTAGLLEFPGTLGASWALAISAVVQLSAGWTPPEERVLIAHSKTRPPASETQKQPTSPPPPSQKPDAAPAATV